MLITGDEVHLTFEGVELAGGDYRGGVESEAEYVTLENIVVRGLYYERNDALKKYGAVYIHDNCGLTIKGESRIVDNLIFTNGYGGGVYGGNDSTIRLEDNTLIRNNNSGSGAGVYLEKESTFFMDSGVKIDKNTGYHSFTPVGENEINQIGSGSGIFLNQGSVATIKGEITGNSAYAGSAIRATYENITIYLDGAKINENIGQSAVEALYQFVGTYPEINVYVRGGTEICNNESVSAAAVEARNLYIEDGKISNNILERTGPAAVFAIDLEMSGGEICENVVKSGSGRFYTGIVTPTVYCHTLNMSGGLIADNIVETLETNERIYGGGIYVDGTTLNISGGKISGHTADYGGGLAIRSVKVGENEEFKINITGGEFSKNSVRSYGGGIHCAPQAATAELNLSGAVFEDNHADRGGAAIYTVVSSQSIANSRFSRNTSDGNGGALYSWESPIQITNSIFEENTAVNYGGGAYIQQRADSNHKASVSGDTVFRKNSGNYGGGLAATYVRDLTVSGKVQFEENKGGSGGGLYILQDPNYQEDNEAIISGEVKFTANTANYGGALLLRDAKATVKGAVSFHENAAQNGGAVYVWDDEGKSALAIEGDDDTGILFADNRASREGGAVYMDSLENVKADKADFYRNYAPTGLKWVIGDEKTYSEDIAELLKAAAEIHGSNIGETAPTDPFSNVYNNFDLRFPYGGNVKGAIVTIKFHAGTAETEPFIEKAVNTYVGAPLQEVLREYVDMYRIPGYGEGEMKNIPEIVEEDMVVDVVYPSETQTLFLTYKANGGMGSDVQDPVEAGTNYEIRSVASAGFSRSGYDFTGWSTAPDGATGSSYAPGNKVQLEESITLYAIWQQESGGQQKGASGGSSTLYTLTYHGDDEEISERHAAGINVTAKAGSILTAPPGMRFTGWSLKEAGEIAYIPGDEFVMPAQNLHLYAVYELNAQGMEVTLLNREDHYAYIIGYPDGTVRPEANMTRAEAITIFFRLLTDEVRDMYGSGGNPFADVKQGDWYHTAYTTLYDANIIEGYGGYGKPNEPITRAEAAAIAARFDMDNAQSSSRFSDTAGHWAADEIGRAAAKGWITGYGDGTFRPEQNITRAEIMALVNRMLGRQIDSDEQITQDAAGWPDNEKGKWFYYDILEATNAHDHEERDGQEYWTGLIKNRDWAALERAE